MTNRQPIGGEAPTPDPRAVACVHRFHRPKPSLWPSTGERSGRIGSVYQGESALLMALSSNEVDLESLLPDVWIAAHPSTS